MMVSGDDQQIAVYLDIEGPQVVVVRSPKPLTEAQIQLLRSCSTADR
jgi:hypothetical protein